MNEHILRMLLQLQPEFPVSTIRMASDFFSCDPKKFFETVDNDNNHEKKSRNMKIMMISRVWLESDVCVCVIFFSLFFRPPHASERPDGLSFALHAVACAHTKRPCKRRIQPLRQRRTANAYHEPRVVKALACVSVTRRVLSACLWLNVYGLCGCLHVFRGHMCVCVCDVYARERERRNAHTNTQTQHKWNIVLWYGCWLCVRRGGAVHVYGQWRPLTRADTKHMQTLAHIHARFRPNVIRQTLTHSQTRIAPIHHHIHIVVTLAHIHTRSGHARHRQNRIYTHYKNKWPKLWRRELLIFVCLQSVVQGAAV